MYIYICIYIYIVCTLHMYMCIYIYNHIHNYMYIYIQYIMCIHEPIAQSSEVGNHRWPEARKGCWTASD